MVGTAGMCSTASNEVPLTEVELCLLSRPALLYTNTPKYTCWMLNLRVFIKTAPGADLMMQLSTLSFFAILFHFQGMLWFFCIWVNAFALLYCHQGKKRAQIHPFIYSLTSSSILMKHLWLHTSDRWLLWNRGSTTHLRLRKQQLVFVSAGNLSKQQLPGVECKYRPQISPFQHLVNETEQLALSLALWDLILLCGGIIPLLQLVNVQLKRAFL